MTEVGRPIPMREARQRVTGSLPFAVNVRVPGMLHGKIVRSTCAHGVIQRLDVSAAAESPGVVGVLVGGDLVGAEIESHYGPVIPDRPLLAIDRVRFSGEPVAAVIAVDEDAAAAACELVDVEYEDLPVLATPEEAMALEAPDIHDAIPLRELAPFPDIVLHPGAGKNVCNHFRLRHGDVAAGLRRRGRDLRGRVPNPGPAALQPRAPRRRRGDRAGPGDGVDVRGEPVHRPLPGRRDAPTARERGTRRRLERRRRLRVQDLPAAGAARGRHVVARGGEAGPRRARRAPRSSSRSPATRPRCTCGPGCAATARSSRARRGSSGARVPTRTSAPA